MKCCKYGPSFETRFDPIGTNGSFVDYFGHSAVKKV
jgi:hypothetical protein